MLFAHGFGCDQTMWRHVAPHFADRHRIVLFDFVGAGKARRAYEPQRHASLDGYADDLVAIIEALDLREVIFVGHSVGCMIGILAATRLPDRFAKTILLGPSPHYLNDGAYRGGFTRDDINSLLENLESNHLGWSSTMSTLVAGTPDQPEVREELYNSFCRMDPTIAAAFARSTFLGDNRKDLPGHTVPTLVLQASDDNIAGTAIGRFVSEQIPDSKIIYLAAPGHMPHLSSPSEITAAIDSFL